jgi:hypothetical protein
MAESPDIRIGTAEREDAMRRLSDHFAAGRLSVAEFDERSGRVAAAMTRGELAPLFADLPEPVGAAPAAAAPEHHRSHKPEVQGSVMGLIVIAALVLFFLTHIWVWFLLIPAAGILLGATGQGGRGHRRDRRIDRRDRRRGR